MKCIIMDSKSCKNDSLLAAVKANNFEETKKFLNNHGLILDHDYLDYKLLIQTLIHGHQRIAKLLLDNGCRVFCPKKTGIYNTPLYYAVNMKSLELVKILLDKGASIKGKDANKETPLIFAMKNKYFQIVDLILEYYKLKNTKNIINNIDEVIHYHIAVMRNNTKLIKIFLEHGMPVDQTSKIKSNTSQGYTPLHFAVKYQSKESVKLLLTNKANFGLKNAEGLTPLHLAFYSKNCKENNEIIDLILSAHSNVMINPTDNNGVSHFHIACCRSNLALIKFFLKSGVDCNSCIFSQSRILSNFTPLHLAVKYSCEKTVKFLLDNKADVNKATAEGVTPLHLAVTNNNMDIVKLLIEYNADVCATDNDKNTAIHKALTEILSINKINKTKRAILNVLFSAHQRNLKNVSNKWGVSLFHIACATSDDPQLIENFLKQNVNINACVKNNGAIWAGYSVLFIAVMTSNLKAIEILLQNNVALKMINSDKHSPLYWVCKLWFDEAIEAIASSTELSPSKTLKDKDFKVNLLNILTSINENRNQIFKLVLKSKRDRDETYDFIMFDVCDIMLNILKKESINSQNEMHQLKISQLLAVFKIIIITLIDDGYDINEKRNTKPILFCLIELLRFYYIPSIVEIIELLLIRGAQVDIEGENNVTPLMMAASDGFDEVVELLLKYKANVNKYSQTHDTPLLMALSNKIGIDAKIANNILNIVDLLLAKGANINKKNNQSYTALHYAAEFPILHKILLNLLQHNCNVDSKSDLGNTALHVACTKQNIPGVITLLYYGADINLVNKFNITPLSSSMMSCSTLPYNEVTHEIIKIIELHVIKLNYIGFKVCQQNIDACNILSSNSQQLLEQLDKPDFKDFIKDFTLSDENNIFIKFCERELTRMKNIKIDKCTSLYSILFKNVHEVSKNVNNRYFKELVNSRELKEDFPLYGYILNLQYKKGLKRYTLLNPANNILQTLLTDLPDLCYERILANFTNQELKTFIHANASLQV